MTVAVELDLPWPYLCEGCLEEVDPPITKHQWEKAMDGRGRFLCERCLAKKLSGGRPARVTARPRTARRGGVQ
jgi:hypothetical protein